MNEHAESLSQVFRLGAYRHWSLPGKIIGKGIIYDVTDDSERDTCNGGTMTVLPTAMTSTRLCQNIMQTLESNTRGENINIMDKKKKIKADDEDNNKNIHDTLIRMSGVFSSFIVDANFSKDFIPVQDDEEDVDENEQDDSGEERRSHPKPTVIESHIRLRRKYCGDPMQAMKLYRTHVERIPPELLAKNFEDNPLPSSDGTLLPGTFCAGNGSNILVATMDLRSRLFEGDNMYIGDLLCVVESVSSARIEIKCPTVIGGYYISSYTGCNLQGWKKKGRLTNELSTSILQCTDMDCIRRIQALQCAHYFEHGHPGKTKMDLPNFCVGKESITIFVIYTSGRKREYKFLLKTDTLAKLFDIVVKEEQVDTAKDVKLRNLRTNILFDSKTGDGKVLDDIKGLANEDTFAVIKLKKNDKWGFFTRL